VEVEQRVLLGVDDQRDAAAVPAVAAVGAAERLELLPADRDAAVPAVTCLQVQHDPVDERGHFNSNLEKQQRAGTRGPRPAVTR
jgi:hypothetical protein